jgi:ABC-type uncharacterized transport system involved in gliding motility auxiliary subunit
MKKKGLQTTIYSLAGVAAMFAILVAINWIAGRAKKRVDLTEEHAYTLSQGTRNILAKLDTPVLIRFYCTQGENRMPVPFKNYAREVEDLLDEYRQASKGKIEIQKLDPEPDSDAEDSAKLDGIEPRMLNIGDTFYLGLSVTMLDQKDTIPFLDPRAGRQLEYEISRAISRVMTPDKPTLGIMSPLPIAGQASPMMMRGRQGGAPPWFFYSELKRTFNVKEIATSVDKIPDDVKVLVLIHPKALTDATQYAIDQFVLRGGKLIAFLDPLAVLDQQAGGPMGMGAGSSSSLDKLLKAWGLTFDSTKVVADLNYVARMQQGRMPTVLALTEKAVNKDDVLTTGNDSMMLAFAGVFSGTPADGLKETVLIKSSKDSQLIDPMMAQMGGEQIIKDFKASGTEQILALRLTGKFKTAFPDGLPKPEEPKPADGKPPEKKPETPAEAGLKESAKDSTVILVGDSDFLQDQIAVDAVMNPFGGQRMVMPRNSNIAFAQGAVEQLAGDNNLIEVRSRASRERPFTLVRTMQTSAEAKFQQKIKDLEGSLNETQRKLNELQRMKAGETGQRFVLSPEQQQEIANFRKKEAEAKKELKQVRKNLRSDIDSLENRIKWLNIAGVPLLVVGVGIFLAVKRRSRQAAH